MNNGNITDKNYIFFKNNFKQITENHLNEFVVIYECSVQGYYESFDSAIKAMRDKGIELGNFIVQKCTKSIDDIFAVYYTTYVNDIIRIGK